MNCIVEGMNALHSERLTSSNLTKAGADELARVMKALAHPVRVRLVNIIATSGEGCACDFPAAVDRSQATVSHHLKLLVEASILHREQRGKWAWFRVNQDRLAEVCSLIR